MKELQDVPYWLWACIAAVLLLQGTWLFRDARKRDKGKMAWFWGLWGLTGAPTPIIVYLLVVVLPDRWRAGQKR
ncbi:Negative regulatory protein YxlD [compost metagenome]